jgi:hypothetical protein
MCAAMSGLAVEGRVVFQSMSMDNFHCICKFVVGGPAYNTLDQRSDRTNMLPISWSSPVLLGKTGNVEIISNSPNNLDIRAFAKVSWDV